MGRRERTVKRVIVAALILSFVTSHARTGDIEPYRYFVTEADIAAMDWIIRNTAEDAVFAVNTHFWLPQAPHGTDGGYWIPYFAERQMTAGVMLLHLGPREYKSRIVSLSRSVEQLGGGNSALESLHVDGVDYVYVGKNRDFSGPGLQSDQLRQSPYATEVYQEAGVSIFELASPEDSSSDGHEDR